MSPRTGGPGAPVTTSSARPAGLTSCSAAGLVATGPGPGVGMGSGVIGGTTPAGGFLRLRTDTRVMASRKATARPMSARTVVAGAVTTSTACPAGLTSCSAAGLVPAGPGLGVGEGAITGKSPAAFPAPTTVVLRLDPGMAAAWMAPTRLAAPPRPMSELVALFGFGGGPGGGAPADGPGEAEGVVVALAEAEPEPVELVVGVGLEEAEEVGLAVGVGVVEGVELALGVGAGDVERVGLGVDVGGEDVEGAGLGLVVGAGVDGDGLGVSEALGPGLVLAAAGDREGEGEGEESTALASAGSCQPADSPMTRKPPVTRPATTTARACVMDM